MTVHVESKCGDPVLDWTAFSADSYPGYIMELSAVMRCAYAGYSLRRGPEIPANPVP